MTVAATIGASIMAAAGAHGPLLGGLLLGTLGKYGLALDAGEPIEPRKVLGHLMMLGVLGLLADVGCGLSNANTSGRALSGATAALLSARLVRAYRRWAGDEADRRLGGKGEP